jgi:hypothetical protein
VAENPATWNEDVRAIFAVMSEASRMVQPGGDLVFGHSVYVEIEQAVVAPLRAQLAADATEIAQLKAEITDLKRFGQQLVDSPIVAEAGRLVAGWNGKEGQKYPPHPFELGCRIDTVCGEVYALDLYASNFQLVLVRLPGKVKEAE